jgi:ribokinase
MSQILVSGLINIETTLQVESFPIEYNPTNYPFFGIDSTVSGVGYNLAKALTTLGSEVDCLSLIGTDFAAGVIEQRLKQDGVATDYILKQLDKTPQSVILYDEDGKRQIHTDLKDIQEVEYPADIFIERLKSCSIACLTNINFSRSFLEVAQRLNKTIAVDVHTISELNDDYNSDFMSAADILFMSDEELPCSPQSWVQQVQEKYKTDIIVVGLGAQGALLAVREDNYLEVIPAVETREVVNTVGAGDALFSAFIHFYSQNNSPQQALKKAVVFASYKIGATSAAEGFLSEEELNQLYKQLTD